MITWNFNSNSRPEEISKKLEASLGEANSFVFKKSNSGKFNIRKRIMYPWYLFYANSLVVQGHMEAPEHKEETEVSISFRKHLLWRLVVLTDLSIGLAILITAFTAGNDHVARIVLGSVFLVTGVLLWLRLEKKYKTDVQEYKSLIAGILES
ncbi:DUF423 domain-containing protein [Robertkochia marina]|uniref:DUF423 domain-containing protein n=1 Tax=Robertkochia marina TaxID=1227945 RepID=A0A4S3LXE5_9FLAO|nr:DUF423 domain-containing protein [Robertkochia marina]THD65864.1 DUF423 domain-containing protein [Robertkochia marina]